MWKATYSDGKIYPTESESDGTDGEEDALQGISDLKHNKAGPSNQEQPTEQTDVEKILAELKKNNSMIVALAKKMKRTEKRIVAIEDQLKSSTQATSNTTPKRPKNRDVPAVVRVSNKV